MKKTTASISSLHPDNPLPKQEKAVQLKRYIKPLMIYGFTIFSNAALSFATFAVLTHHLTEVDYGTINLYNSFLILLMPFVSMGIPFVLNVDYFKMDKEEFSKQFTNGLVVPLATCVLLTFILLFLHGYIERVTKVNYFFVAVAGFSCLLLLLNDVILNFLRNREQYFLFAGISLAKNLLEISLTIWLVIGLGYNWTGRLGSNFITLVVTGMAFLLLIRKWRLLSGKIDRKTIGTILLAGLPFIPERLALFTMGYSDRFFIDHFSGTADVGYYGAGAQVAMIVNLSIITLNNTFYPKLFRGLSARNPDKKETGKVLWMYMGFSTLISLAVIACTPFLFQFFIGPNFQPGKTYAIYLTIGFFFWSFYNVFVAFLLNIRKNKLIMRISLFGMILSVAANFINVKRFGALGATYTSMLVYFSMTVITVYFVHKYYNLRKIFTR